MGTKLSKRIGHDSMSISGKMLSGALVKLTIGRNGEKLEVAFGNDEAVAKRQLAELKEWLKNRKNETNQERFDRLEKVLLASDNSTEFMNNLKTY